MHSNSRRAFLTGQRSQGSPWEMFLARLRRRVEGRVYDFASASGSARLLPKSARDVHYARTLCHEFGVSLTLDGVPHAARLDDAPVLWVEPGADMARFERLGAGEPLWFVQPGCLVGELEAAGLQVFKNQPPHLSVAAWLADRSVCDWPAGRTQDSGLVHAALLLADGTEANLGAFGTANRKPLDNARVQTMVPKLFELAHSSEAQELCVAGRWNGRYRLDALRTDASVVNLAHLLLGSAGELGWVQWVVMDERAPAFEGSEYAWRYGQRPGTAQALNPLDNSVKTLFDPDGLFPARGQNI